MFPRIFARILGKIVSKPIKMRVARFDKLAMEPERVQNELLMRILRKQAATGFGRDHHFSAIRTVADYRHHVPVAPYDYVAPYIERVRRGEIDALLSDPVVLMFALTSGTSAERKLIPVTPTYLRDYRKGWSIWGMTAMRHHKSTVLRPMLQMVGDPEEYRTELGIPCGNLSGYTAEVQKWYIRWLYSVPPISGRLRDPAARYYTALRFSVPRKLGMLLAANPSTLVALARRLDQFKEPLIRDIADGTLSDAFNIPPDIRAVLAPKLKKHPDVAKRLESIVNQTGRLLPMDVWPPSRILLGTWTGGSVGLYLRQLSQYYGETPIRDLGLLASEGRMTLPMQDHNPAGVIDITTHYYEFIPENEIDSAQPTVLGAHEVREGESYFIVPTTAAGLYRYHISDLVRVSGFHGRTPMIEFLGKGHRFASLTGEKLSEHHVTAAMASSLRGLNQSVSAYTLAPCWDDEQPYYGLFIEQGDLGGATQTEEFLRTVDRELATHNIEYAAKRESGRLGPVRLQVLAEGAWTDWDRKRLDQTGGSPEQYKRPCLIGDTNFRTTVPILREIAPRGSGEAASGSVGVAPAGRMG